MCRKSPEQCKAKIKCKCCKFSIDKEQEDAKLTINEVDIKFEQQQHVIDIKGE